MRGITICNLKGYNCNFIGEAFSPLACRQERSTLNTGIYIPI